MSRVPNQRNSSRIDDNELTGGRRQRSQETRRSNADNEAHNRPLNPFERQQHRRPQNLREPIDRSSSFERESRSPRLERLSHAPHADPSQLPQRYSNSSSSSYRSSEPQNDVYSSDSDSGESVEIMCLDSTDSELDGHFRQRHSISYRARTSSFLPVGNSRRQETTNRNNDARRGPASRDFSMNEPVFSSAPVRFSEGGWRMGRGYGRVENRSTSLAPSTMHQSFRRDEPAQAHRFVDDRSAYLDRSMSSERYPSFSLFNIHPHQPQTTRDSASSPLPTRDYATRPQPTRQPFAQPTISSMNKSRSFEGRFQRVERQQEYNFPHGDSLLGAPPVRSREVHPRRLRETLPLRPHEAPPLRLREAPPFRSREPPRTTRQLIPSSSHASTIYANLTDVGPQQQLTLYSRHNGGAIQLQPRVTREAATRPVPQPRVTREAVTSSFTRPDPLPARRSETYSVAGNEPELRRPSILSSQAATENEDLRLEDAIIRLFERQQTNRQRPEQDNGFLPAFFPPLETYFRTPSFGFDHSVALLPTLPMESDSESENEDLQQDEAAGERSLFPRREREPVTRPLPTREPLADSVTLASTRTGEVPPIDRRFRVIRELREENNGNVPPMSRSCRVCFVDEPLRRSVLIACGHAVCRACAEQLASDALAERKQLLCPFCRMKTGFVNLREDAMGEINA